jgi:hypothetical protein
VDLQLLTCKTAANAVVFGGVDGKWIYVLLSHMTALADNDLEIARQVDLQLR